MAVASQLISTGNLQCIKADIVMTQSRLAQRILLTSQDSKERKKGKF